MTANPTPDLGDLLSRVALGDRRAFEALYQSTCDALLGIIFRINGDRAHSEEILQEVFIAVWKSSGSFNAHMARPMTWLISIARNRAIDHHRRKAVEPKSVSRYAVQDETGEDVDLLETVADPSDGPLDLLDRASSVHSLQRCMDRLTVKQRSSIALAYYDGLSHVEVAGQLSEPLGTIKSWIRRGLLSLKDCLDRAAQPVPSQGAH